MGYWHILVAGHWLLAGYVVVSVLRTRKEPTAMLAWVFSSLTVPYLASVLYLIMGSTRVRRRARRRQKRVAHMVAKITAEARQRSHLDEDAFDPHLSDEMSAIERIARRLVNVPAIGGNCVQASHDARETFAMIERDIRAARHHVHLQYYIWKADEIGGHFRDLLIEKARAGVVCRVLLDAVGCLALRKKFCQPMLDAGVKIAWFLPLIPGHKGRWSPHLRNHRKIAVMDGCIASVGSQNIGDEYMGRLKRLSPWYDTQLSVCGPAALFLQQTFAEDWLFACGESLGGPEYFPEPPRSGDAVVQILPTGPDQEVSALGQIMFAAVSGAHRSVRIATPYFVPDPALRAALLHACYRGVKLQLVLPTRSDAPLVLWAGRSFYAELLDAGAEIFEFDGGMLHSKIMTVDDSCCMVGSANMDVRSFRLNFEITALVYDQAATRDLAAVIDRHCQRSRLITQRDVYGRSVRHQVLQGAARLFSPLL